MTIALLRKRKSAVRQGIDLLRKLGDRANVFVPGVGQPVGPVNLLLYSNSIANAAWSKVGATATDGALDPWGGSTASTVTDPAATNGYISQTVTDPSPGGKTYTFGFWLKAGTKPGLVRARIMDSTLTFGGQQDITPQAAWTFYTVTVTFAAGSPANVRAVLDPLDNTTGGNYYICSAGLFLGAYTDSQLLALGGVPVTAAAPSAGAYLPWVSGTSLSPTAGSQALGPETIANGDFSQGAAYWNLAAGTQTATISGGVLRLASTDGSGVSAISQAPVKVGDTYLVTINVTAYTGTACVFSSGAGNGVTIPAGTGLKTLMLVTDGNNIGIKRLAACDISLTLVSAKLVTTIPASAWLTDYVESGATTPGAVDGPVGFLSDGEGVVGPALVRSGLGLNGNTDNGDGTFTALAATGNAIRIYFGLGDLVQGASYLITLNILSPGAITADWCDVTSSVTVIPVTPGKSVTFISSRATYDATYRFLDVLSNSGNVRFSYSVQMITGRHATQVTGANKPVLRRGAVNRQPYCNLLATGWVINNGGVPTNNAVTGPDGVALNASLLACTGSNASGVYSPSGALVGETVTQAIVIKTISGTSNQIQVGYDTQGGWIKINPQTGVIQSNGAIVTQSSSAPMGNGYTLYAWSYVSPNTSLAMVIYNLSVGNTLTLAVAGTGQFAGALTAAQILACGGIPLTTSVAASATAGNFGLEHDGTKYMSLPAVPFQMNDDHVVIAGCRGDNSVADRSVFGIRSSTASTPVLGQLGFTSGVPDAAWRGDDGVLYRATSSGGSAISQYLVLALRKQATTGSLYVNGAQAASVSVPSGATTVNTAAIGGVYVNGAAGNLLVGMLYAIVVVKGALSDAEFLVLRRFVGALTGPIGVKF